MCAALERFLSVAFEDVHEMTATAVMTNVWTEHTPVRGYRSVISHRIRSPHLGSVVFV